jgi:sugar/nucleoside kinase (ribokinase family)
VGRNIADALGKLGAHPFLISAIGNDQTGNYLLKNTLKHVVSIINELLQVIPVTGKQLMHTGIVKSDICRCIVYFYLEDKPKRENTNKYDLRKKIRQVQHLYDTYSQYFFITEYL